MLIAPFLPPGIGNDKPVEKEIDTARPRTKKNLVFLTKATHGWYERVQMIRVQTNILAVLVFALSVASIFMTHTLFTVVKNVQFEKRAPGREN